MGGERSRMNRSTQAKLDALRRRLQSIDDISSAAGLLMWDQTTYMPAKGGAARGRQLATLEQLAHEQQIDVELGRLLDDLQPLVDDLPPLDANRALIEVARWDYDRAVCVPAAFVAEHAALQAASSVLDEFHRPFLLHRVG